MESMGFEYVHVELLACALLLLSSALVSLLVAKCEDVVVRAPPFSREAGLIGVGTHAFDRNGSFVYLTPDLGGSPSYLDCRVMYDTPVQLYDEATGSSASFKTSFIFSLWSSGSGNAIADGMTFLIAPTTRIPDHSSGGGLALFDYDPSTGLPVGESRPNIVAVEFDTFTNDGLDPVGGPHVGLDVNSLNSTVVSLQPDMRVNTTMGVWIEYNASSQHLQVKMSFTSDSEARHLAEADSNQVLTYSNFNLSSFVNQHSYVGFSGTTGGLSEIMQIWEWNFTTTGIINMSSTNETSGQPDPPPPPTLTGLHPPTSSSVRTMVVGVTLGSGIVCLLLVGMAFKLFWRWRRRRRNLKDDKSTPRQARLHLPQDGYGPRHMSYDLLSKATNNFTTGMLGEGGSGGVYIGVMKDGSQVAVKRIKQANARHGEKQFIAEVSTIGQVTHKNLVPLKGWCHERGELLLVFEYMRNGSLDRHLYPAHGNTSGGPEQFSLGWQKRFHIISGLADALHYLHQGWRNSEPLIHRDVKPSNVMLDDDLNARLADFGLALVLDKNKVAKTVTSAAGTLGYLAPECNQTGQLQVGVESDVYSFGVVALEVACGRKPLDWRTPAAVESVPGARMHLHSWVWSLHMQGRLLDAMDYRLRGGYDPQEALRVLQVGLMCSFTDRTCRPTMSLVTQFLEGSIPVPELLLPTPADNTTSVLWSDGSVY